MWPNLQETTDLVTFTEESVNGKLLFLQCFLWSILAFLQLVQHGTHLNRVLNYQEYEHELNLSGIQYPIVIKSIGKFEHQNNISVNVYGYEDKKIFLLRIISMTIARDQVSLLYITAGEKSH